MITTILFDLDGTLLPMDEQNFIKIYMGGLVKKFAPIGYDVQKFTATIWQGMQEMVQNDGSKTNEQVFWDVYSNAFGANKSRDVALFEEYYTNDFPQTKLACGFNAKVPPMVAKLQRLGFRVIIATNPFFPQMATRQRVTWAGLNPDDFFVTTYENSRHCKPNVDYYQDILQQFDLRPEECIMVGNDALEDMIAQKLGLKVFLLTDQLINKHNLPTDVYPQGGFDQLEDFFAQQLDGYKCN